jgi:hypothetical protein
MFMAIPSSLLQSRPVTAHHYYNTGDAVKLKIGTGVKVKWGKGNYFMGVSPMAAAGSGAVPGSETAL